MRENIDAYLRTQIEIFEETIHSELKLSQLEPEFESKFGNDSKQTSSS